MAKPKTLADRIIILMDQDIPPAEIADRLQCSPAYVRVCISRARMLARGYRRTSYGNIRAMTDEELTAYRQAARDLESATKRHGNARLKEQQRRARALALHINARRALEKKERDDMIDEAINRRRQHVNRILQAWKETA